jgi:hypothetical protein
MLEYVIESELMLLDVLREINFLPV